MLQDDILCVVLSHPAIKQFLYTPRHKNSPETPLYKKGENLFGLHAAKHAIRRTGRALLVEGNFDVMTLHELGIDYAVAPQGTAITEAQVALLSGNATARVSI